MRVTLYKCKGCGLIVSDVECFECTNCLCEYEEGKPESEWEPIVFAPLPSEEARAVVLRALGRAIGDTKQKAFSVALTEIEECWKEGS